VATPLENLQTLYANLCAELASVSASLAPTYTVDGVTLSREQYVASLVARIKELREVPGVAPTVQPVFEVWG